MGGYYGTPDPFAQGFQNAQMVQDSLAKGRQMVQDAYLQREANDRANAKQLHDQAVDNLETRLKLLGSGATPVSPDGSVGISGQIAQAGAQPQPGMVSQPAAASSVSVPGGLPDAMAQAPPQLPPQAAPDMSPAQRIMEAGTQYSGQAPANPALTVVAPDGSRYQLPSLDQRAAMADAANARDARAAGAKAGAEESARKEADADDLKANGIDVPDPLADYLGLPRGQKATLKDLHQMVQDTSTRKHNEVMAAIAAARELDAKRGLDIQQQRADQEGKRVDGLLAKMDSGGAAGNDGKPLTAGQKAIQNRADAKELSDLQAEQFELKDQQNKLAAGVKNGKIYFDSKGKATPLTGDESDSDMIDEMRSRLEAVGSRIAEIKQRQAELIDGMRANGSRSVPPPEVPIPAGVPAGSPPPIPRELQAQPQAQSRQAAAKPQATPPAPAAAAQPQATLPPTAVSAQPRPPQGRPPAQPKIATTADIAAFAKQNKIPEGQARQIFASKGWTIAR